MKMNFFNRIFIYTSILFGIFTLKSNGQQISFTSPDKSLNVKINISQELSFEVLLNGNTVLEKVTIDMKTSDGRSFGTQSKLSSQKKNYIEDYL